MLTKIIALIIILPVGLIAFLTVSAVAGLGTGSVTAFTVNPVSMGGSLIVSMFPLVLTALVFGGLIWAMAYLVNGPGRQRAGTGYARSDTQLIQDMNHIASRLEARVEALETIMLERPGVTSKR